MRLPLVNKILSPITLATRITAATIYGTAQITFQAVKAVTGGVVAGIKDRKTR